MFLLRKASFWFGLFLVMGYWFWIRPPDISRFGYMEDFCGDLVRQMMADNLTRFGSPTFFTDRFMSPDGASAPFMSWSVERDWLGAWFWLFKPDFPFLWVYFGASLLISYLGVGVILKKMNLSSLAAWLLAAGVVVFHVPRHYKAYHHFEHLPLHWVYLGFFLDAWIWKRFWRDKKLSLTLEAWRGLFLLGVMNSTGILWGPTLLEWMFVRAGFLFGWADLKSKMSRDKSSDLKFEADGFGLAQPVSLIVILFWLDLKWFLPLTREANQFGNIYQPVGWHTHLSRLIEPLWIEPLLKPLYWLFPNLPHLKPIDTPETVVSIGYLYWVPLILAILASVKKQGWTSTLKRVAPLGVFLVFLLSYALDQTGTTAWISQQVNPFMKFFRVSARVGLFLPILMGALIAILWEPLEEKLLKINFKKPWIYLFVFLSLLEVTELATPVRALPPLGDETKKMLAQVGDLPGDTVLDLPFCTAGGNGYCTTEQCPNYPASTIGQCFRMWHDKKVYGLYQARMTPQHCLVYDKKPFTDWFDAWRHQRCLYAHEWDQFCQYLDTQPSLSAVLVYPGIWKAAGDPSCRAEFERRLGPPQGQAWFASASHERGKIGAPMEVIWFKNKCKKP